jgi:hypothetical protein
MKLDGDDKNLNAVNRGLFRVLSQNSPAETVEP